MNEEQLLQLQAWVDGELPEGEARQIEKQLETDAEARALADELKMTKAFLVGNEPEHVVTDSREFYWSQIQRRIEREAATTASASARSESHHWTHTWRRFLAPVAGFAVVVFLTVLGLNLYQRPKIDDNLQHLVEVENLDEHTGSIAYKSQSENMFVVYLYNKESESTGDDEFDMAEDSVLQ